MHDPLDLGRQVVVAKADVANRNGLAYSVQALENLAQKDKRFFYVSATKELVWQGKQSEMVSLTEGGRLVLSTRTN